MAAVPGKRTMEDENKVGICEDCPKEAGGTTARSKMDLTCMDRAMLDFLTSTHA